jgi:hypothetical protein
MVDLAFFVDFRLAVWVRDVQRRAEVGRDGLRRRVSHGVGYDNEFPELGYGFRLVPIISVLQVIIVIRLEHIYDAPVEGRGLNGLPEHGVDGNIARRFRGGRFGRGPTGGGGFTLGSV